MSITTERITQEEPVHFRVREIELPPVEVASQYVDLVLFIEYVNKPGGARFGVPMAWYLPYRAAVEDAVATQRVYWVDWDYSKTPSFPPREEDTTLHRLLKAIQNRQIVAPDPAI